MWSRRTIARRYSSLNSDNLHLIFESVNALENTFEERKWRNRNQIQGRLRFEVKLFSDSMELKARSVRHPRHTNWDQGQSNFVWVQVCSRDEVLCDTKLIFQESKFNQSLLQPKCRVHINFDCGLFLVYVEVFRLPNLPESWNVPTEEQRACIF